MGGFDEPPRTRDPGEVRLSREQVIAALAVAADGYWTFQGRSGAYGDNRLERHITGHLGEMAVADWFELRGYQVRRLFTQRLSLQQADLIISADAATEGSAGGRATGIAQAAAGVEAEPPRGIPVWGGRSARIATGPEYMRRSTRQDESGSLRLEVKTWRSRHWPEYGRSLAARQLPRVVGKADALIWCTVPDTPPRPQRMIVQGWTPIGHYLAAASPVWRPGWSADITASIDVVQPVETMRDSATWPERVRAGRSAAAAEVTCSHELLCGRFCWQCLPLPGDAPEQVLVSFGLGRMYHQPSSAAVREAHDGWPFRSTTRRVPFAAAAVELRRCWRCFPASGG